MSQVPPLKKSICSDNARRIILMGSNMQLVDEGGTMGHPSGNQSGSEWSEASINCADTRTAS